MASYPSNRGVSLGSLWQTLRFRFALWTVGLLLLALVVFGTIVYFSMQRSLHAAIDETLRLNATQALSVFEVEEGQLELPESFLTGQGTAGLREQDVLLRTLSADGQVLQEFGDYSGLPVSRGMIAALQRGEAYLATVQVPGTDERVRLYSVPIIGGAQTSGIYQVGQSLTEVEERLADLVEAFLIGGPALLIVAGTGGYWLAARALRPIDEMTRTAQRISAEDLSERLNLQTAEDEVGRLARTFNGMLARLEDAFRRERQFTADASHELRTPLTAMQTILDVTLAKQRSPGEYTTALQDLKEENEKLRWIAEDLLRLAHANGAARVSYQPLELSTLVQDVVESLRPGAEKKGLRLHCETAPELEIRGDRDSIVRLMANLIDNAIKYSDSGTISVSASRLGEDQVRVEVQDTGIGIPAEHLPHIFERFYRVDTSRASEGIGLGLAIAQATAESHGGSLEVSSQVGVGTRFVVELPGQPPSAPA